MSSATLVIPSERYLLSYLEACREYKEHQVSTFAMDDPSTFHVWRETIFQRYEDFRLGHNLLEGYVPASTFWLVEGGQFVGTGNIRHRLTESLTRYGGHIGYAIRWGRWNQGYGTLQLRLLLAESARLGIERALVTCNEENIGSARVMEKNGGVFQDTIDNLIDGKHLRTRRYWINTNSR